MIKVKSANKMVAETYWLKSHFVTVDSKPFTSIFPWFSVWPQKMLKTFLDKKDSTGALFEICNKKTLSRLSSLNVCLRLGLWVHLTIKLGEI